MAGQPGNAEDFRQSGETGHMYSPRPEVVAEQLTTMGMTKTLANQETGYVCLPRPEVVAEQLTTMGMPKMVGRYFSLDRK